MKPFSRIISGTMTWGAWGNLFSSSQMQSIIEEAVDMEIYTFDNADIYGDYTTEFEFGKAFSQSNVNREKVQFITKCGIQLPSQANPLRVKHYDYSGDHIRMSVENSLRNLHTDYIDLLLIHRPSPLMEVEVISKEFQKLQKEGKVKYFGVSNFNSYQMQLLQKEISVTWNQIQCSLTHETPMFDGTLDYMKVHEIGVMAWNPLGLYFKEDSPQKKRIKKILVPLCEKYDCSDDQLLLAWLLQHPSKIHPVIGTKSIARLKKSIMATKINLDLTDWFLMLEASIGKPLP